jgi:twitching motility two-component system response regulator PilG
MEPSRPPSGTYAQAPDGLVGVDARPVSADDVRLIVDDIDDNRDLYTTYFKYAGFEVEEAKDGEDALSKVTRRPPDLIVMDLAMPNLDGWEATRLIKSNPRYASTPVIMLSSKDGLFDRARGRIVGSDEYLTKPFTRDELISAVRTHLRK